MSTARCAACEKDCPADDEHRVRGAPRLTAAKGGGMFEVKPQGYACSGPCRPAVLARLEEQKIPPTYHELRVGAEFSAALYAAARRPGGSWAGATWCGVPILKNPADLMILQEIVCDVRPGAIVETGTFRGGSALFLAHVLDGLERGVVHTVDATVSNERPSHPRITYHAGSSTDPKFVAYLREKLADVAQRLVVLDSDHSRDHVLAELRAYAPLVTPGSYVVVEDTNVDGPGIDGRRAEGLLPEFGPGPWAAVRAFLASPEGADFVVDRARESKYLSTFNPGGYLRRLRAGELRPKTLEERLGLERFFEVGA